MHFVLLSSLLFFHFSFFPAVLGHGYVSQMVIGGKTYKGPSPYGGAKLDSPIRKITSTNPITDVESADMTCGIHAATTAAIVAPATAGSKLTFTWRQGSGAHWGHSIGPIMTYMAKCPASGCQGWNPKGADFFKISQTGRKPNSMTWYMADIKAGKDYTTTIPQHIPNGDYIVRHEMIALHFATSPDAAQLFPSCSQVRITGGADVSSMGSVTTAKPGHFPGSYKATDPGIYVPNIYKSKSYTFPGPAVATFTAPKSSRAPHNRHHNARNGTASHHHGHNGSHPTNSTLHPHHPLNVTSPLNTTSTTPLPSSTSTIAFRILPSNPIKLGPPIVIDTTATSAPSLPTESNPPFPVFPLKKRDEAKPALGARTPDDTAEETEPRVLPWMPIAIGSAISSPTPTPTPSSGAQHRPHGHHPRPARRRFPKRLVDPESN